MLYKFYYKIFLDWLKFSLVHVTIILETLYTNTFISSHRYDFHAAKTKFYIINHLMHTIYKYRFICDTLAHVSSIVRHDQNERNKDIQMTRREEKAKKEEKRKEEKSRSTVSSWLFRLFDIGRVSPRQYRANN